MVGAQSQCRAGPAAGRAAPGQRAHHGPAPQRPHRQQQGALGDAGLQQPQQRPRSAADHDQVVAAQALPVRSGRRVGQRDDLCRAARRCQPGGLGDRLGEHRIGLAGLQRGRGDGDGRDPVTDQAQRAPGGGGVVAADRHPGVPEAAEAVPGPTGVVVDVADLRREALGDLGRQRVDAVVPGRHVTGEPACVERRHQVHDHVPLLFPHGGADITDGVLAIEMGNDQRGEPVGVPAVQIESAVGIVENHSGGCPGIEQVPAYTRPRIRYVLVRDSHVDRFPLLGAMSSRDGRGPVNLESETGGGARAGILVVDCRRPARQHAQ